MQTAGPNKAVICHLDRRNCAATRASSDVRRTTEIKPEPGGWLASLLNISRWVGIPEIYAKQPSQGSDPWWGPLDFGLDPNIKMALPFRVNSVFTMSP